MSPGRIERIRPETLKLTDPVERWLMLLQDFKTPEKLIAWDIDDKDFIVDTTAIHNQKRFISAVEDVFAESVLACCWILKRLNDSCTKTRFKTIPILRDVPWMAESPVVDMARHRSHIETEYATLSEAANILGVNKGTISRLSTVGKLRDNGLKGRQRKISKISIVDYKSTRESRDLRGDIEELRRDAYRVR